LKEWLKSGRSVWYITGNWSDEKCIELVEESRKKFNLASIKIEELPELRTVALESNTSFHIEIPLEDKTNENSCNLTYFEVGPVGDNTKEKLINDIIMQFLDEPFYSELRTKQQLGYVVYCRTQKNQDLLGNIFTVQSPTRSAEYIVNSINEFLVLYRDKIKNIPDEEFETVKKAVLTIISEKDINLSKENDRFMREISSHKYNFSRQSEDITILATITKSDFQSHFERIFFSDFTKRLDLQLVSETHAATQEQFRASNADHIVFKDLKRVKVDESIVEFKKQCGMHPDTFKANFAIKDYNR
jgi:secreted Zn-dependent insulinase-like peptidase